MAAPMSPVAAEIAHHAHVLGFDESLDRGANVAGGGARLDHRDAAHHRLVSHLDQPLGAARNFADRVHAAGIAVPAVEDQRHVDIDNVALAQRLLHRDAVTNHVIDRRAGRFAVAAIHQGRRQGAMVAAELIDQPVDALGGDARLDLAGKYVEAFGRQRSRLAHACEGGGVVNLDLSGLAQRREGRVDIGHGALEVQPQQSGCEPPLDSAM